MLSGFPEANAAYAKSWLERKGVRLVPRTQVAATGEDSLTLLTGEVVRGIVYTCTGAANARAAATLLLHHATVGGPRAARPPALRP